MLHMAGHGMMEMWNQMAFYQLAAGASAIGQPMTKTNIDFLYFETTTSMSMCLGETTQEGRWNGREGSMVNAEKARCARYCTHEWQQLLRLHRHRNTNAIRKAKSEWIFLVSTIAGCCVCTHNSTHSIRSANADGRRYFGPVGFYLWTELFMW